MSAVTQDYLQLQLLTRIQQRLWLVLACLATSDLLGILFVSSLLPRALRAMGVGCPSGIVDVALLMSAAFAFLTMGLYPTFSMGPAIEFRRILVACTVGYAIPAAAAYLQHELRVVTFVAVFGAWLLMPVSVIVCRGILRDLFSSQPWWSAPAVVFGSGENARSIVHFLGRNRSIGLKVVGVFDNSRFAWPELEPLGVRIGLTSDALSFAKTERINHAIITVGGTARRDLLATLSECPQAFKHLLVVPDLSQMASLWVEPRDVGGLLALYVNVLERERSQVVKRAFDIVMAACMLVLLLPLFLIVYTAIRLTSKGPAFYSQARVGMGRRTFRALKFRTMYTDADQVLNQHLDKSPELREEWARDHKLKRDPRTTCVGRLLRKTSVDELPQLWNVLIGDMSLVGPRPIVDGEVWRYGRHFAAYSSVRPGITGMWQISGRNNTSYEERVKYDEYYSQELVSLVRSVYSRFAQLRLCSLRKEPISRGRLDAPGSR